MNGEWGSALPVFPVGMNCPIGDDSAIIFSSAFYGALCNANKIDYEKAFKLAIVALLVKKSSESSTPEIWKNGKKLFNVK